FDAPTVTECMLDVTVVRNNVALCA
ncbi:MAG: hypothetical protein QOJ62_2384, partial [Actinomycetota bacterium]|nr:hypothetical protein [Actinomycetota bacterium]